MEATYNQYLKNAMSHYYSDDLFIKSYGKVPKFRDETFKYCLDYFNDRDALNIVELGTSRSFVDGKYEGCCNPDLKYWKPSQPQFWDWSAGMFTKCFPEMLLERNPEKRFLLTTVDINPVALHISSIVSQSCKNHIIYVNSTSEKYLSGCSPKSIDLLYVDTGDLDEHTAQIHKKEAMIIVERNLLKDDGLILIDDVRNPCNEFSRKNLGKSKYSIPYLLENGYEYVLDEYQVILKKIT